MLALVPSGPLWALPGHWLRALFAPLLVVGLAMLGGCAGLALSSLGPLAPLQPGVANEADVRARLGEPGRVWPGTPASPGVSSNVARVLEYSGQPFGHRTYMADIAPDGKLIALRQVLTPENFQTINAGMARDDVERQLGKPLAITHYSLKNETHYDWRYRDGFNWSDSRVFSVVFNADQRVVSTGSIRDPDLDPKADPYVLQGPGIHLAASWFGGPVFGLR